MVERQPDAPARQRRRLWTFLPTIAVPYLAMLAMLMLFENMLVYPGAQFGGGDWNAAQWGCEDVTFTSADGTELHGWYREHSQATCCLLVCHGNGENVANMGAYIESVSETHSLSVFAWDYRGYGKSGGKPHEEGVLADADAAHQWLAHRESIAVDEVVILGRSLGGSVAVDLAARNGARGLVLERTFTSLPDVAARQYWWVPVRLLMRHRYDSVSKIGNYRGPLLQCHGTADEIVPFDLGQQLFDAASGSEKRFVEMPGVGHNEPTTRVYERALREFLETLASRS